MMHKFWKGCLSTPFDQIWLTLERHECPRLKTQHAKAEYDRSFFLPFLECLWQNTCLVWILICRSLWLCGCKFLIRQTVTNEKKNRGTIISVFVISFEKTSCCRKGGVNNSICLCDSVPFLQGRPLPLHPKVEVNRWINMGQLWR